MRRDPDLVLASPRGFCAGVERAIEIVELSLEIYGSPIYVRHEIVHNRHVVEALRARGAIFVDELAEVPRGSRLVFSAHGVSPAVRKQALERDLRALDATCPLVTKVHVEALRYARNGYEIILVGHRGHVEVEGTLGHAPEEMHLVETLEEARELEVRDPERLAVLTQTTLSVDDTRDILAELSRRFPKVRLPGKDDICYATQNRQNAVKAMAREVELVLVIGAPRSSNSRRLVEVARKAGVRAELIESADQLDPSWLEGTRRIGVSAGASAPEALVTDLVERLQRLTSTRARELEIIEESMHFALPQGLKRDLQQRGADRRA